MLPLLVGKGHRSLGKNLINTLQTSNVELCILLFGGIHNLVSIEVSERYCHFHFIDLNRVARINCDLCSGKKLVLIFVTRCEQDARYHSSCDHQEQKGAQLTCKSSVFALQ